jgi:hypothetical protein
MNMITCPHPALCGARRHRGDSGSRRACDAKGKATKTTSGKVPPVMSVAFFGRMEPETKVLRFDEVTKDYSPELYRAIRKSPKHYFDKKTGAVNVFKHQHLELPIGEPEDEQVQRWFTRGACGGLALAMHERTGWPLVVIRADKIYGEHTTAAAPTWVHLLVRHPSGMLLDIEGLKTDEQACQGWPGENHRAVTSTLDEVTENILKGTLDDYEMHERALIGDYARLMIEDANEDMPR